MKIIELTQGKSTIIDDDDFAILNSLKWYYFRNKKKNTGYAMTTIGRQNILMHRLIMNLSKKDKIVVDHIDGDGLNNQKSNLRIVSLSENSSNRNFQKNNTSGYIGISWDKSRSKWMAQVISKGKVIFGKRFDTKEEAIESRIKFIKENNLRHQINKLNKDSNI